MTTNQHCLKFEFNKHSGQSLNAGATKSAAGVACSRPAIQAALAKRKRRGRRSCGENAHPCAPCAEVRRLT